MRTVTAIFLLALAAFPRASAAQDHGTVTFMSGLTVGNGTGASIEPAFSPGVSSNMNFAGRVGLNLTPGFQAVGEMGRLGNVLPPIVNAIYSFSPYEIQASAFYGEGGVRALAAPRSAINPYVEATGGFARLNLRISGAGATPQDLLALGLGGTSRTSPVAGLGGGVMFHAGALTLDVGYRYKKIFSDNLIDQLLSGGQDLTSQQVAFGVGIRF